MKLILILVNLASAIIKVAFSIFLVMLKIMISMLLSVE
jgi:hypothetical protein